MYLKETIYQRLSNKFCLACVLISILLSGCQSLPSFSGFDNDTTPFETVETHEFILGKNQDIVGIIASIQTKENDTLPDIARHFGLGFNDIAIANAHLDPWLVEPDNQVLLPLSFILPDAKRQGIVLNLASMRLFNYPKQLPERVITYPIGIGRNGWNTPTGLTKIIAKKKDPAWHVPASIRKEHARKGDPLPRIVPAGPNNPLGAYAMRLSIPSYLIHGTNKPYGVGMQISHGCVRLYPEDIATLFQQISTGTPVKIIDQPYLLGWDNEMLFLEAHNPLQSQHKTAKAKLLNKLKRISQQPHLLIDWPKVDRILNQANGVPTPILINSPDFASIAFSALPLTRPQQFYQQPIVQPLTQQDWSIKVASFTDDKAAQKLVALLNHQGPSIPSRRIQKNGLSYVVAGPYRNQKEVQSVIAKIQREFQFNAVAQPPQSIEDIQHTEETWGWLFGGNSNDAI